MSSSCCTRNILSLPSQQEKIHGAFFCFRYNLGPILGTELRIQYTCTYAKTSEHYRFSIRYIYPAFLAGIYLVTVMNTHTCTFLSQQIEFNMNTHMHQKITGNSKCIYSRLDGAITHKTPTVPKGATTPENPRKVPRTPAEPRRDPAEPSERPRGALSETPAEPSERQISSESLAEGCAPRMVSLRNFRKDDYRTELHCFGRFEFFRCFFLCSRTGERGGVRAGGQGSVFTKIEGRGGVYTRAMGTICLLAFFSPVLQYF